MLTKDSANEPSQRRIVTIPFYMAISVVLLVLAMVTAGGLLWSATDSFRESPREVVSFWSTKAGWDGERDGKLATAILNVPIRYLQSMTGDPDLPTLVIDLNFRHQQFLQAKRDLALERGFLIQEGGDFVPASIRTGDREVDIRLRLKGDLPDHFSTDKWSMRIEVKGDDHILGMRRFSLQHPSVRSFQAEPIFMETLRHAGVLAVRYQFVHLIINGEDKGIMALEEHFSKELLEHQARREGVFLRFDETNFFDHLMAGGNWRASPYDNFRNSRVRTFGAKDLATSPALSAQFQTAAGMLRSFASDQIPASELFDIDTTASYLAVLELWGSRHSIQWNDIRFYFDPLTMKLEPIGYDANPVFVSDTKTITLKREPLFAALLQDPLIRDAYLAELREICNEISNGNLGSELLAMEQELLSVLRDEFLLLEPMRIDKLVARAEFLLELDDDDLLREPETYPRRLRYPALVQANLIEDQSGLIVEIANLIPEPVTVTSVHWRNLETGATAPVQIAADVEIPFELAPAIAGQTPDFNRLDLLSQPDLDNGELLITANYARWPQEQEIHPVAYIPELRTNPVPEASIADQLSRHAFLGRGEAASELTVQAGQWSVDSDIIVPSGFTLSMGPGTTLEFAPGAALISNGALSLLGTDDQPVVLRAAGPEPWPGIAVLRAGGKSILRHVEIENTIGISRDAWQLGGGVTFHHSDVEFEDVSIRQHGGEDALNIVRSEFDISRLLVADTIYDGFDADFTTGVIRDSEFINIGRHRGGGDAIDVSGSRVEVRGVSFRDIADKAVSVGEASSLSATDLEMSGVGTAAASKDGSLLEIDGMVIEEIVFAGLMAYIKKPEYGPASIRAENVRFEPAGPVGRVQTGSVLEIDGVELATEDLDVDLLYETVMRKGL